MIGLRLRLLGVVALVAIPSLAVVTYQGLQEQTRAEAEARRSLLTFAELVAVNQDVLINQTRTLLQVLATIPDIQNFRDPACDQALADLLRQHPGYTGFGVLGANGTRWCLSQPINGTPDHSDLPHYTRARATGDFAIGDFAFGRITGKATLGMALPMRDAEGRIYAVVVAALGSEWATDILGHLALPAGSAASLVDAAGTIVARVPDSSGFIGGGRVWALAEPDKGATFFFTLPGGTAS